MGTGWPFLVAAGRVRDHAVLVAPEWLVASGEYGVLESVGVGGGASPSADQDRGTVRLADGRLLAIAFRTRPVTTGDVTPASASSSDLVRDEHNRPLQALVGIVTAGPVTVGAEAALDQAWDRVLPAYRRFLEDEPGFAVAASGPMPVVMEPAPRAVVAAYGPSVAAKLDRENSSITAGAQARATRILVSAVVALLAGLAIVVHPWTAPARETPTPTPTPTHLTVTTGTTSPAR